MLQVANLAKTYGGQPVLRGLEFQLNAGERAGLVGRNGAGKTTLMRIILGQEEPDAGSVIVTPGESVGYLAQDLEFNPEHTLHDELLSVFADVLRLEERQRAVEAQLGQTADEQALLALVEEHDALLTEFDRLGGHTIEREIGIVMAGLGFQPEDRDKPVGQFSGGWQMRVGLARLLLQAPDILLLDEPTNHLDLYAVEWLAEYLRGYRGSIFIVSHDRWLLDRVCTRILELDGGTVTAWAGNYSAFLRQKAQRLAEQEEAYARQQEYLAKQQVFIDRFRGKPSKTRAVQSREKLLEKMEKVEAPPPPGRRLAFRFPPASPSGRETMLLRRVTKTYDDHPVFEDVGVTIERGDRIALIGPNGAGKTTLLRLLARDEPPTKGTVTWGHNVQPAYFTQHQAESLDHSHTVLEEVYAVAPRAWSQTDVRGLLGRFLFRGDDVHKAIGVLSGGERSRVALAKLLLRPTNVLLLDEPTNHLDIPAREVLEEALSAYSGAFVIATHDRYLLDQLTNKVIEVDAGRVTLYDRGYREYVEQKGKLTGRPISAAARAATPPYPPMSQKWPKSPAGASRAGAGVGTDDRLGARERPSASAPTPSAAADAHSASNAAGAGSPSDGRAARSPTGTVPARPAASPKRRSELRAAEQRIEQLERQSRALAERLADPDLYRDYDQYHAVLHEHEALSAELTQATERWEELARLVEG